jgi:uncharacterized membrane protein YdjX (TVP38/TMEM64 family)
MPAVPSDLVSRAEPTVSAARAARAATRRDYVRAWLWLAAIVVVVVLVPFVLLEGIINDAIDRYIASAPSTAALAFAVIILLALDIVLPIPSSVVATTAGAALGFWPGIFASVTGMTICCQLGYGLGRVGGRAAVRRFVDDRVLDDITTRMRERGHWVLGASRAVPVLAEGSVLVAGLARMKLARFTIITSLANVGVSCVYCALGARAIETRSPLLAIAGAIGVPALAIGLAKIVTPRGARMRNGWP